MIRSVIILLLIVNIVRAQQPTLITINTKSEYAAIVIKNPEQRLVNVKNINDNISLDLKYSGVSNFTKTKLYTQAKTTYLLQPAATALKKVCDSLAHLNLYIKIWDAYRPYAATKLMWELIKDERYVANPKSGSNHNRGLAVDITLVSANGQELDMGTSFDNFTDSAHHSFTALSATVLTNRRILKGVMEFYGFKALETEWWHYSYTTNEKMAVFDLSFKVLRKLAK